MNASPALVPTSPTDTLQDTLARLRQSPAFAMSLGARELFHSNFLAFILESADPRLERLQRLLREALRFPVQVGEHARCMTWREHKNLDLVLVPLNASGDAPVARALCIEVKIKSIPTPHQLERYRSVLAVGLSLDLQDELMGDGPKSLTIGAGDLTCVLLSPRDVLRQVHPWTWVSWQELAALLSTWAADGDKLSNAVMDYAESLSDLMRVVTWVQDCFDRYTTDELTLGKALCSIRDQLRGYRLHDLGMKYFFSLLEEFLRQGCPDNPAAGWVIDSYTGYSNGEPLLGIEWVRREQGPGVRGKQAKEIFGARIGVQIQGTEYRHLVAVPKDFPDLESVCGETLLDSWFKTNALGRPLRGLRSKADAQQAEDAVPKRFGVEQKLRGQPRLTNLRAYIIKRFLYTATVCGEEPVKALKAQMAESMALASRLCQQGGPMHDLSDLFQKSQLRR